MRRQSSVIPWRRDRDDELARIFQLPEVLKCIPDKATAKARQEKMLEQIDKELTTRREAVQKSDSR